MDETVSLLHTKYLNGKGFHDTRKAILSGTTMKES